MNNYKDNLRLLKDKYIELALKSEEDNKVLNEKINSYYNSLSERKIFVIILGFIISIVLSIINPISIETISFISLINILPLSIGFIESFRSGKVISKRLNININNLEDKLNRNKDNIKYSKENIDIINRKLNDEVISVNENKRINYIPEYNIEKIKKIDLKKRH